MNNDKFVKGESVLIINGLYKNKIGVIQWFSGFNNTNEELYCIYFSDIDKYDTVKVNDISLN